MSMNQNHWTLCKAIKIPVYTVFLLLVMSLVGCNNDGAISSTKEEPVKKPNDSGSSDNRITYRDLITNLGDGAYFAVAHHPGKQTVAVGTESGSILLFDYTGDNVQLNERLIEHSEPVRSIAFNNDGSLLVSGSDDGSVNIWDMETSPSEPITSMSHDDGKDNKDSTHDVTSVAFSGNGERIVSGSLDGSIKVWSKTGEQIGDNLTNIIVIAGKGTRSEVYAVASNNDGSRIISSGDGIGAVKIWDWDGRLGRYVHTSEQKRSLTLTGIGKSLAFHKSGDRIISGDTQGRVLIWNRDPSTDVYANPGYKFIDTDPGSVPSLALSIDGKRLIIGNHDETLTVWNADADGETAEQIGEDMSNDESEVFSVAFGNSDERIVSVDDDRKLKIWNTTDGTYISPDSTGHKGRVYSANFNRDGTLIVSGGEDKTVKVWRWGGVDKTESRVNLLMADLIGHTDHVTSVAFNSDGNLIASGSDDETIKIWKKEGDTYTLERTLAAESEIRSIAFDGSGNLVSGGQDDNIRIWNASTGNLKYSLDHGRKTSSVVFSEDRNYMVSGSLTGQFTIWDRSNDAYAPNDLLTAAGSIRSVAISYDNTYIVSGAAATSGSDAIMQIWNVATRSQHGSDLTGDTEGDVSFVAFNHKASNRIVSGGKDKIIRIWNATRGNIEGRLIGHREDISSVAFSRNDDYVVSSSINGTVKVWCVKNTDTSRVCE